MAPKKQGKKPKRRTRTIVLKVIPEPEPESRAILVYEGEGTLVMRNPQGPPITMVCGNCRSPLIQGVEMSQVQNLAFRCNNCMAFNETLA